MDTKYNGWTNYETWNVKLWLDNDEGSQGYWQEQAQEAYDDAEACETFTRKENAAHDLRERLKSYYDDALAEWMPEPSCCFTDLLNSAVASVNWHEIAESLIEDCVEEEATA